MEHRVKSVDVSAWERDREEESGEEQEVSSSSGMGGKFEDV